MPGAVLILFVSGGVCAMALAVWIVLRRSRARSQLILPTHSAALIAVPAMAYRDERSASPELAGTAVRGGCNHYAEPEGLPSEETTQEEYENNGDEGLSPPLVVGPAPAVQAPETESEDAPPPGNPLRDNRAHATAEAAAKAEAASGVVEVPAGPELEGKVATVGEPDLAAPTEGGQEESLDLAIPAASRHQGMAAPLEFASPGASAADGLDSSGPTLRSPPNEPHAEDEPDLADTPGEAGSAAAMAKAGIIEVFASPGASDGARDRDDRENGEPHDEQTAQPPEAAAPEPSAEPAAIADDLTVEAIKFVLALTDRGADQRPQTEGEAAPEQESAARMRPSKPAQHRDRRGQRRPAQSKMAVLPNEASQPTATVPPTPAEARLRLMIHPIRRTVAISAVLARPSGYPSSFTLLVGNGMNVGAYGEDRYDDVDLEWTAGLLSGEVRLESKEGYQWLRSSRRVHIFGEQADEQGLISVGAAALNSSSAVVCTHDDAAAVRSAAAACGSPELVSHDRWSGVPEGWAVLSGYRPAHAASAPLGPHLTTLDPGVGAEIRLSGGLQVRANAFAQGSPPRIEIQPFPVGAQVTINGRTAEMSDDGCWRAEQWDGPGDHLVDVVPGPSLTYRIVGDPWAEGGWEAWDAHADRFHGSNDAPWTRAQICGASVLAPSGEHVVAAEAMSSVIALGLRRGVAILRPRPDAPVAVGILRETPAFLISSSGPRRTQGRVDWLVPPAGIQLYRTIDQSWVAVVRSAASRRLPLSSDSSAGQEAWRRARARARRYRKAGA